MQYIPIKWIIYIYYIFLYLINLFHYIVEKILGKRFTVLIVQEDLEYNIYQYENINIYVHNKLSVNKSKGIILSNYKEFFSNIIVFTPLSKYTKIKDTNISQYYIDENAKIQKGTKVKWINKYGDIMDENGCVILLSTFPKDNIIIV